MTPEKRSNASFEFQPVLNRCDLDSNSRPERRLALCETPTSSRPNLRWLQAPVRPTVQMRVQGRKAPIL